MNQDLAFLLRLVIRHYKGLAVAVVCAAAAGFVLSSSFFLTPLYRSETLIYPSNTNTNNHLITSGLRFGSDKEIDEQMQILESAALRDAAIRHFDLAAHYDIDISTIKGKELLLNEYSDHVSIGRTRYNSISVSVSDADPAFAAEIANGLVRLGDDIKTAIVRATVKDALHSLEREWLQKKEEVKALHDSIELLRLNNYRQALELRGRHVGQKKDNLNTMMAQLESLRKKEFVYDYGYQYNNIYGEYLRARMSYLDDSGQVAVMEKHFQPEDTALVRRKAQLQGAKNRYAATAERLEKLTKAGRQYNQLQDNYALEKSILGEIEADYDLSYSTFDKEYPNLQLVSLKNQYTAEVEQLTQIKIRYDQARASYADIVPASFVISAALPSPKPSWPNRKLIIALFTIAGLVLPVAALVLWQYFKNAWSDLHKESDTVVALDKSDRVRLQAKEKQRL